MKLAFIFLLLLGLISSQAVISRNGKVKEMIDALKENDKLYDDVTKILEDKMKTDYDACIDQMKSINCQDSQIWQQQRSKASKNITNLKDKIKKHNQTIDSLLQLNKQEVTKKNLTMVKFFPQIQKIKNDIELIENMLFLIEDTYINLDTAGKSLLLLFDHEFNHQKAQEMQKSFLQLMNKHKGFLKADPPKEGEKAAEKPKEEEKSKEEGKEKDNKDKIPLIDEDIFDGESDTKEISVGNLFQPTEEESTQIAADEIPNGVSVPEHDQDRWGQLEQYEDSDIVDDLRINEIREEFKNSIKEMGKIMHEQLKKVHDELDTELDMRTQSVTDLEKAMIDLHHKHAKQIVQIYIETKKLSQTIFELDDYILKLDAQIFDCENSDKRLEKCETRKGLDQVVLDDLKTEKSFNTGVLKELDKLTEFEDKNVNEPGPMEPTAEMIAADDALSQQAARTAESDSKIQQRINAIKEEENEVQQELQDEEQKEEELKQAHPELYQDALPAKLSDVAEIANNIVIEIPEAQRTLTEKLEKLEQTDENNVLDQIDLEQENQEIDSNTNNLVFLSKNKK